MGNEEIHGAFREAFGKKRPETAEPAPLEDIHGAFRDAFGRKRTQAAEQTSQASPDGNAPGDEMYGAFRSAMAKGPGKKPDAAAAASRAGTAHMPEMPSPQKQAFEALAEQIRKVRLASGRSSVVVTSAEPGEGRTLGAAGLAAALAGDSSRPALLLDCDLRRPSLKGLFRADPTVFVEDLLSGRSSLERAALPVSEVPGLHVALVREPREDAAVLCSSFGMTSLLESAHKSYAVTVIDSPAVLVWPDACSLARESGGVILFVRTAKVQAVKESVSRLRAAGGIVLGVVPVGPADGRFVKGADGEARGLAEP